MGERERESERGRERVREGRSVFAVREGSKGGSEYVWPGPRAPGDATAVVDQDQDFKVHVRITVSAREHVTEPSPESEASVA